VLYNCGHPKNSVLTPELVNAETGAFLHRFQWLDDEEVGAVSEVWNWLEGWSCPLEDGRAPNVVHYTRGGPWFDNWQDVSYAAEWLAEEQAFQRSGGMDVWNILDFWFEETGPKLWYTSDAVFDKEVRERFGDLHARAVFGEMRDWRTTPWGALAEILLLDQFSRNIHRGGARVFANDAMALEAHREAMAKGFDRRLTPDQRKFLYLPLQRSKDVAHQAEAVALLGALG